ncbi:MAG: OmpA family protein [Daejeonella sp.]
MRKITLSLIVSGLFVASFASAQDTENTMNTPAKIFGGRAQYRTWSLGLNAGALAPVVLTGGSDDFSKWGANLGYGLTLRKQLGHVFGIEGSFLRGKLSADNEGVAANDRLSYETELGYSAAIMGVAKVGSISFLNRENAVSFFAKAGYGVAGYSAAVVFGNNQELDLKGKYGKDKTNTYVNEAFIPLGAGVKFKLSERLNFDLGYNMYFLDGDNLDATYAKPQSRDKWSYAYAGVEFSLGSTAKPNLDWVNPVAMMYDELKDGTLGKEVEALKARVTTVESTVSNLLKDTDKDGVADKLDKCPGTEAGVKVDGAGCPLDTDGDGVADSKDGCPLVKGTVANKGCPEVAQVVVVEKPKVVLTVEEKAIVDEVFKNLEFTTGKAVIRPSSFPSLEKLAGLLKAKPDYKLTISGHTDDVGKDAANQVLSKNRANAVKLYLTRKKVKNKITALGFGETKPIADNKTEEGRQANRRVEFDIN